MEDIYFVITLTVCSVVNSLPQESIPQNFRAPVVSDVRIVNRPPHHQPVNPDALNQGSLNPFQNRHRPPNITSQRGDAFQPTPSPGISVTTSLPPTLNTLIPGNFAQSPDSQLTPVTDRPPSSGHNSHPALRERSCGKFPSPGECQAAFPRYYYNQTTSQCDCYLFGGCDEDTGSYRTLEECHNRCHPEVTDEGPNCKFVYIDNFSPIIPSTTEHMTVNFSTTPSYPAEFPTIRSSPISPPITARPLRPIRPNLFIPQRPLTATVRPASDRQTIRPIEITDSVFESNHPLGPHSSTPRPLRNRQPVRPNESADSVFESDLPLVPHTSNARPLRNRQPARPHLSADSVFESDLPLRSHTEMARPPRERQPIRPIENADEPIKSDIPPRPHTQTLVPDNNIPPRQQSFHMILDPIQPGPVQIHGPFL